MKHLIVCLVFYAATGLAGGYSHEISARDLHPISTNLWTRRSDNKKKPSYSRRTTPNYNRLVRRASKGYSGMPATSRPPSPSVPSSGTIPRANQGLQASSAASSVGSNNQAPKPTRPKSALTAGLQAQEAIADQVYTQVRDPKKKLATLSDYRHPQGLENPTPFRGLSPKNAAAAHHAAAYSLANQKSRYAAHDSRLHAMAAFEAAKQATEPEVGSAEKYAIAAHQHADRSFGNSHFPPSRLAPPRTGTIRTAASWK